MMMTRKIKIAAAQYPLDELKDLAAYEAKITRWVDEAVSAGAGLLVFPEYGAMELSSIGGNASDVQSGGACVRQCYGLRRAGSSAGLRRETQRIGGQLGNGNG